MRIEHVDLPGFGMDVLGQQPCESESSEADGHLAYKVIDPEGAEDWLCERDVRVVES